MSQLMDGTTQNLINENLQALKQLFPEAFSEDRVDFEKLQLLLGKDIINDNEKYSFTWKGKNDAIKLALAQTTGTLRPDKASSKNWDTTENLYIEWDNLEVLRCLQDTYRGKVKMIYIDPPYNTGKDFVYKDNYVDNVASYKEKMGENMKSNPETNGRYHTDWLNMMYPRLKLARNLLREDGVIFISIDDNEVSNLKKICDEIFWEEKFIATFKWNKTSKAPTLSNTIRNKYEYILFYANNEVSGLRWNLSYNTVAPLYNISNRITILDFPTWSIDCQFEDGLYKQWLYGIWNKSVELMEDLVVKNGINDSICSIKAKFKWSQSTLNDRVNKGQRFAFKKPNFTTMYYYLDNSGWKYIAPSDIISMEECNVARNDEGYTELYKLFDNFSPFDYTKPSTLIKFLTRIIPEDDFTILDFFSGSATTAHAVMQLNSEDGGNRKFICVQIPEITNDDSEAFKAGYPNICEIGKERVRRAGDKIKEENKDKPGINGVDIWFKCFKLDTTNLKKWDNDIRGKDIIQTLFDHTNMIKEWREDIDMVYEVMLKYGIDLTDPVEEIILWGKSYFSVSMGHMIAYFGKNLSLADIKLIVAEQPKVVVISDEAFESNPIKINAIENLEKAAIKVLVL